MHKLFFIFLKAVINNAGNLMFHIISKNTHTKSKIEKYILQVYYVFSIKCFLFCISNNTRIPIHFLFKIYPINFTVVTTIRSPRVRKYE